MGLGGSQAFYQLFSAKSKITKLRVKPKDGKEIKAIGHPQSGQRIAARPGIGIVVQPEKLATASDQTAAIGAASAEAIGRTRAANRPLESILIRLTALRTGMTFMAIAMILGSPAKSANGAWHAAPDRTIAS